MIKKIVSGGQTGAHQAALDAAVKLGIPHGGWIPKGRLTENGPLPEKYQLKEMPTNSYPKRTEQNVLDSDGTLIISHGDLTGASALTRNLADKHARPWLHLDMNELTAYEASKRACVWLAKSSIRLLNVAGSRASGDPRIYQVTTEILETVFELDCLINPIPDLWQIRPRIKKTAGRLNMPRTLTEAVAELTDWMPLKEKVEMARLEEDDLPSLNRNLGSYVRLQFGLIDENSALRQSVRAAAQKDLHEDEASALIIKELWKRLKESHVVKAVK